MARGAKVTGSRVPNVGSSENVVGARGKTWDKESCILVFINILKGIQMS